MPLQLDNDMNGLEILSLSFAEDPFDSSTWAIKSNQRGSLFSLQMSVGWSKCLVEEGSLPSKMQQSAVPSHPPKKLHLFHMFPEHHDTLPIQFSSQWKRAAMLKAITWEEVMFPWSKKRMWHSGVDCKDTYTGKDMGEEWPEPLETGGWIQVDTPLC